MRLYRGKPLLASRHAAEEMAALGLDDDGVVRVLEEGAQGRKRARGVEEKWLPNGGRITNVVAAEHGDRIVIVHVGEFTATRRHMRRLREQGWRQ